MANLRARRPQAEQVYAVPPEPPDDRRVSGGTAYACVATNDTA